MSTQPVSTPVRTSIVVEVPVERAFQAFTTGIADWWPPSHHLLEAAGVRTVLEPRAGGRILDLAPDGRECAWARLLAYEPPHRIVFSWDINLDWQPETDPDRTSEVEVRFTSESPASTRVDLEHRKFERHGEGWDSMQGSVGTEGGWPGILERFAAHVRG